MVVGFPVGGEQFAAESEFLRLTAIAEVEQCCVQQLRINVSGFPCDIEISGEFLIRRRFRYSYSSVAKVGIGHYNDDSRNLSLSRRLWQITIACSYDGSGSMTNWSAGVFDEGGGYFLGKPDQTGGIILEPGTHDISLTGIVFRGTSEIERQTHEWNSQFRSGKADPVSADCDTILARHRRPPGGPPNQSTSRPSTTTSRPKI